MASTRVGVHERRKPAKHLLRKRYEKSQIIAWCDSSFQSTQASIDASGVLIYDE